jgi:hypothetical protein
MNRDADALKLLISEEKFDEVLSLISGIEGTRRLTVSELILKGSSVQLSSGVGTPPLSEAERAYLDALEQDSEYVPALIELGWFYYAVEDDARMALPLFERAIAVGLEQLREAIKGKRDCVEELQSGEAADEFLRNVCVTALTEQDFSKE